MIEFYRDSIRGLSTVRERECVSLCMCLCVPVIIYFFFFFLVITIIWFFFFPEGLTLPQEFQLISKKKKTMTHLETFFLKELGANVCVCYTTGNSLVIVPNKRWLRGKHSLSSLFSFFVTFPIFFFISFCFYSKKMRVTRKVKIKKLHSLRWVSFFSKKF